MSWFWLWGSAPPAPALPISQLGLSSVDPRLHHEKREIISSDEGEGSFLTKKEEKEKEEKKEIFAAIGFPQREMKEIIDYQADPFALPEEEEEEEEDLEAGEKEKREQPENALQDLGALQENEEMNAEDIEEDEEANEEEEQNQEMEMEASHPKEESKWKKIQKWSSFCLLLSLLLLGIIVAVDLYLFSAADSSFATDSIDFYFESDDSADAKCVVRGEYPTHSAFSSYNLVHPKCVLGYSNEGKSHSHLNTLTTTHISVERLGSSSASSTGFSGIGVGDRDPIKISIDLKNTQYDNFGLFLMDVLDHSSKNSYVHLDCRTDLEIHLLDFIPVTSRNIKVARWFPVQVNHQQKTRDLDLGDTNGTERRSLISNPETETETAGWKIPKSLARQEFPKFSLTSASVSKLEVGADWMVKNPIHFAKYIPSVVLHVPEISYSMSALGNDHIRWNSASTPLEFDLTHSHFHLETNFTLETRDGSSPHSKLPLASSGDVFQFFDRLSHGEIDVVWDAETDNFLTRLLGMNHHVGVSVNASIDSAGSCRELSVQYNGNATFDAVGCSAQDEAQEDELWRFLIVDGKIDPDEIISLNTSSFMNQKSLVAGELKLSSETSENMNETAVSMSFRLRNSAEGNFEASWSSQSESENTNGVDMNLGVSLMVGTVDARIFEFTSQTLGSVDDHRMLLDSETSWCLNNNSDAFRLGTEISFRNNSSLMAGELGCEVELESFGSVDVAGSYDLQDPHDW